MQASGDHPFSVGQKVKRREGLPGWPQIDASTEYTVTELGVNTFPPGVMQSPYWVKVQPETPGIIYWGTRVFAAIL